VQSKLFKGAVTNFARPSANFKMDQLYHVMWEDGDEQDFDQSDFQRGVELMDEVEIAEGWISKHDSIGTYYIVRVLYDIMPINGQGLFICPSARLPVCPSARLSFFFC
jgi:hypothetical protein